MKPTGWLLLGTLAPLLSMGCRIESISTSRTETSSSISNGMGGIGAGSADVIPAPRMNYVINKTPISLKSSFRSFVSSVQRKTAQTELHCSLTSEISGLFLCAGTNADAHHFPLMRAAIFAEGRPNNQVPFAGQIVSAAKALEVWSKSYGHDLTDSHLMNFFMALKAACPDASCIDHNEFVFADKVMPVFSRLAPQGYSVISFEVSNTSIDGAVAHEIAHGQFFQQPQYRNAVLTWFNTLPFDVQQKAAQVIGLNYDIRVPDLLVNEFHAYTLMGKFDFSPQKYTEMMQTNDPTSMAVASIMMQAPQLQQSLRLALMASGHPVWAGAF